MTITIAPYDLVLRDGRAEEVQATDMDMYRQASDIPHWRKMSDAARIGSTRDGWRIHTGSERPEGVGVNDMVALCWNNGDIWPEQKAAYTRWNKGPSDSAKLWVVAYRVLQRAEPPISGQGGNCGAVSMDARGKDMDATRQVPASELWAVAEEIRKLNNAPADRIYMRSVSWLTLNTWADRISLREPEPLKVGDRVRQGGITAELRGKVDEEWIVMRDDRQGLWCWGKEDSGWERIP